MTEARNKSRLDINGPSFSHLHDVRMQLMMYLWFVFNRKIYCFAESHLQRHHLHQDGKVGEVVAEAHRVVEVPTLTHTTLVRPNTSPVAAKHKNQNKISVSCCRVI